MQKVGGTYEKNIEDPKQGLSNFYVTEQRNLQTQALNAYV